MSFNAELGFDVQETKDRLISKIMETSDAGFVEHMLAAASIHEGHRSNYGTPAESFVCELVHHWAPRSTETPLTPELAKHELEEFEENFAEMAAAASLFTLRYQKVVAAIVPEVAE